MSADHTAHSDGPVPVGHLLSSESVIPSSTCAFSAETINAVKATLKALYDPHDRPSTGLCGPSILPDQWLLLPEHDKASQQPSLVDRSTPPLTLLANVAAGSLACGSILAGQGSEADEFGDVGFWLGPGSYGTGHELAVLHALGLEHACAAQQVSFTSSWWRVRVRG